MSTLRLAASKNPFLRPIKTGQRFAEAFCQRATDLDERHGAVDGDLGNRQGTGRGEPRPVALHDARQRELLVGERLREELRAYRVRPKSARARR